MLRLLNRRLSTAVFAAAVAVVSALSCAGAHAADIIALPDPSIAQVGSTVTVAIRAEGAEGLAGFQLNFHFDPQMVKVKGPVSVSNAFDQQFKKEFDNSKGEGAIAAFILNNQAATGQSHALASIDFEVLKAGTSSIDLSKIILGKAGGIEIPSSGVSGEVTGTAPPQDIDADGDGWTIGTGDCDDNNPAVHPGATDLCNGVDDNCNGQVDEGFSIGAACTSGLGECARNGVMQCDQSDNTKSVCSAVPGPVSAEVCDGLDNNCDGQLDEGIPDYTAGLSLGICRPLIEGCSLGAWTVVQTAIQPQSEACGDGIDQDCNGSDLACSDADNDGVYDGQDNCPSVRNTDQSDIDGDGIGDACDGDIDGDGVPNGADNCPLLFNSNQTDHDGDGAGDACDSDDDGEGVPDAVDSCPNTPPGVAVDSAGCGSIYSDRDGDGVPDNTDNCPLAYNPDQSDNDVDGVGDACDADDDNDGVRDGLDNCPLAYNPDQSDNDGDGVGDACDPDDDNDGVPDEFDGCRLIQNASPFFPFCSADSDGDGINNEFDNCPNSHNPGQEDFDGDGAGDACDMDDDGDGVADINDNCPAVKNISQSDAEGDGIGDACDFDNDNDGVPDTDDLCPGTPPGKAVDKDGCPVKVKSVLAGSAFYNDAGFRATFSLGASSEDGVVEAASWVKYYYSRTRMNFASTAVSTMSVAGKTVTLAGVGTVNGIGGYTFTATAADGSPDSFAITIRTPAGALYYSYSGSIAGGDIALTTTP